MPIHAVVERLARLEQNFLSIERRSAEHESNDDDRYEQIMSYSTGMRDDILKAVGNLGGKLDAMDTKIDVLWDEKNQRTGAILAGKYIIGGIGAFVGTTAGIIYEWLHK